MTPSPSPSVTLGQLAVGTRAKVLGYHQAGGYRKKLLSLGLTPGAAVEVTRVAPLGDPVEIRLRGFSLSLRRDEAAALTVEILS